MCYLLYFKPSAINMGNNSVNIIRTLNTYSLLTKFESFVLPYRLQNSSTVGQFYQQHITRNLTIFGSNLLSGQFLEVKFTHYIKTKKDGDYKMDQ